MFSLKAWMGMDGCFGLSRKKDKGHNLGTPKHGTLLFADQDDVDNFVNSYGKAGAHWNRSVLKTMQCY